MHLGQSTCGRLAAMLCDEISGTPFPARSAAQIEQLFHSVDIDASNHDSSKYKFAQRIISTVDQQGPTLGPSPHPKLVKLIEAMATQDDRYYANRCDHGEVVARINEALQKHDLRIELSTFGKPRLVASDESFVSTASENLLTTRKMTFSPDVFKLPEDAVDPKLVAVMMSFDAAFVPVHEAIKRACTAVGFKCERADEIWKASQVMQDIFGLIATSSIVVSDFTRRNTNVFYETGIAHTLGKHVIPIAQSEDDVPFDLRQHRYIPYHNNGEGLQKLTEKLTGRLKTLAAK